MAIPAERGRAPEVLYSMDVNGDQSPLSIGYFSVGWPLDAFPNGVVSYVVDMDRRLREAGHRVTVVAAQVMGGPYDTAIYRLQQAQLSRGSWRRLMDRIGYQIAPKWAGDRINRHALVSTIRHAVTERDIQLFEMEEAFGWPWWVRRATSIPVCVRLHGPWFLNSPAMGLPDDDVFLRRVIAEGRAIADADAVTAPSHDVLERTRAYYRLPLHEAVVIPPPTPPIPEVPAVAVRGLRPELDTVYRPVRPPQGGGLDDRGVRPRFAGAALGAPLLRGAGLWPQR